MNTFTAAVTIPAQKIADQVITAIESGIAYWAESADLVEPTGAEHLEQMRIGDPKVYEGPFKLKIVQQEEHTLGAGTDVFLTPENVQTGLTVMATRYGKHFQDMMDDNGDADTADVFIQCCVFGDLVYG
jgi:hypothetical protein